MRIRRLVPLALVLVLTIAGTALPTSPRAAATAAGAASEPAGMRHAEQRLPNGDVMHYTETGPATAKPILFVHGYPTSSFLYRNVIGEICGNGQTTYRCIAVDLIGFGRSSCPGTGRSISPAYEADRLTEFIDAMDLEDFALVIHDWGGPIGAAAGLRRADRMSELVILNTSLRMGSGGLLGAVQTAFSVVTWGPLWLIHATYPTIVDFVMQDFTSTWLPRSVRSVYIDPYRDWNGKCRTRASLNLFAKAPYSGALFDEIEQGLTTTWAGRPAHFLWGEDDVLMGPNTALGRAAHDEWASRLPQAETVVIEGADHFMQEDRPVEVARGITDFLADSDGSAGQ